MTEYFNRWDVEPEKLPEKVWVLYLTRDPKYWRIEVRKRSPALKKIPRRARIYTEYEAAKEALLERLKKEADDERRGSEWKAKRAIYLDGLRLRRMSEL